jgi:pimeloyl-ACP methyl ester carboxylesterase
MADPFEIAFDGAVLRGEAAGFGMPVVFLHAGVADRRMWADQIATLAAEGYHVVAYDRRGFGETTSEDVAFSHLVDLETLLDSLGLNAVVLVGCSMGGGLAIDFAIEHPDRVVGLVLVGTSLTGDEEPEQPEEIEAVLDTLAYAEQRGNVDAINRIEAHLWLDGPLSKEGRVDGPARELFLEMNRIALEHPKLTKLEQPDPAVDNVERIMAPVLLVVGALDFPYILERHEDLAEVLDDPFAVVLDDTAHLPSLERPEEFTPLLLEFLEALAGRGEAD